MKVFDLKGSTALANSQIAAPIEWAACLDAMVERGCKVLLELGPYDALARMARERHKSIDARSCSEFSSLAGVIDWIWART